MSAVVPKNGRARQLERPAQPDEQLTEADVADASKLTRALMRILKDVASLMRRWWPETIEYEDISCGAGGARLQFPHNFGGAARYVVRSWHSPAAPSPSLQIDASSDGRTLVLRSYTAGTATIQVVQGG